MAIHDLISAGRNTNERSFMTISRSVSRNSRTRFKFFLAEKMSKSCTSGHIRLGFVGVSVKTHLDDVWMSKLA